jgi:hypothetical protein
MYEGIIAPILNIRPHPNADRLVLATVAGHQVILAKKVGTDDKLVDPEPGQLGAFFPADGQISHEMAMANKLYRKDPETGETWKGYFEPNRRVRAQRLRGQESEGFWIPLESLSWTGIDVSTLKSGHTFTSINGKLVCNKYYSPATLRVIEKNKKRSGRSIPTFKEHFETDNLRYKLGTIPPGAIIHITEKLHGTSGRTGYLREELEVKGFKKFWNKHISKYIDLKFPEEKWEVVSGTRRTVLDTRAYDEYVAGRKEVGIIVDSAIGEKDSYRFKIHRYLRDLGLKKGETLYYEIVGWADKLTPIMPSHPIESDELKKVYNTNQMFYNYGCKPGEYKVYVYRITMTNEDGKGTVELSWPQVKARCKMLGLEHVPEIKTFIYSGEAYDIMIPCRHHADGPSMLDSTHIKEGVCLKIEHPERDTVLKYKGYWFSELEGIKKNDDTYVDPEEVA